MARATFGWRRLFGPTVRGHAPRESEVYSPQPSRGTGARRCRAACRLGTLRAVACCSCRSVRRAAGKRNLCSSAIAGGSGAANLLRHLTTVRRATPFWLMSASASYGHGRRIRLQALSQNPSVAIAAGLPVRDISCYPNVGAKSHGQKASAQTASLEQSVLKSAKKMALPRIK